jgi:hypothetical protein
VENQQKKESEEDDIKNINKHSEHFSSAYFAVGSELSLVDQKDGSQNGSEEYETFTAFYETESEYSTIVSEVRYGKKGDTYLLTLNPVTRLLL